jgi:uncharacterized protein YndB with AHSA1/START domain
MTDYIPAVTDRDVYITRSFAAPIDVVWKFWTDPDLVAQWFGPHGISIDRATVEVDAREGGAWNLAMEDEQGIHPLSSTIVRMIEPEYLELVIAADTGLGPVDNIILRVQFHDHGETTRMTLHQGPFTPELRDLTADGWTQSFDKLDAIIAGGVA